jgi:hypothetical protein
VPVRVQELAGGLLELGYSRPSTSGEIQRAKNADGRGDSLTRESSRSLGDRALHPHVQSIAFQLHEDRLRAIPPLRIPDHHVRVPAI